MGLIGFITLCLSTIKGAEYRDPKDYYGLYVLRQSEGGSWEVEITEDYFILYDYAGEDRKECNYIYKTVAMRKDDGEEHADTDCMVVTIDDFNYHSYRDLSGEGVPFRITEFVYC